MPQLLERSLDSPASNLALDEALLLAAEADEIPPVLRLWQFASPTVVVGRGSKATEEVQLDHCRSQQIPILRRCSGGATVMGGPGCLMYSLVIDLRPNPHLRQLNHLHSHVMQRVLAGVQKSVDSDQKEALQFQGICDLTYQNRKFSGNSLRITRHHVLYHGTILLASDLGLIAECLATAPRQPTYRQERSHRDFITNVPANANSLRTHLAKEFEAQEPLCKEHEPLPNTLEERVRKLTAERYGQESWTLRH